jgi:hypothetical protein
MGVPSGAGFQFHLFGKRGNLRLQILSNWISRFTVRGRRRRS